MSKTINRADELADGKIVHRAATGSILREINKETRTIDFIISTAAADRYGDTVQVKGWDLRNYRKNPVVLFGHNSRELPIGRATKTWKDTDALMSQAQFMDEEVSEFADSVYRMLIEGYLKAVSVGFRPLEYEWIKNDKDEYTGGINFKKQELLEFSVVPIPANPECLIDARRKGINTTPVKDWAEEMLDDWAKNEKNLLNMYAADRLQIENIRRRAAGGDAKSYQVPLDVQDDLLRRNLEAVRKAKEEKMAKGDPLFKIDLTGVKFEVPVMSEEETKEFGQVVISTDDVNGEITRYFDKTDDNAKFDAGLISKGEFTELSVEEDGDEERLVLTLRSTDDVVRYEIIGVQEKDNHILCGVKIPEETKLAEKASVEEASVETPEKTETVVEESSKEAPVVETGTNKEVSTEDTTDTDEDTKLFEGFSPSKQVTILEDILESFEDAFKGVEGSTDKHLKRKAARTADYLRDIADSLDGGQPVATEKKQAPAPVKDKEPEPEKGLSKDAAEEYIGRIVERIGPILETVVADKISKARGRLDSGE